jgi:hypothetical protein
MNSALLRLLLMRMRGGIRQRLIQLKSLRGLIFSLAVCGIIWLLIVANGASLELDFWTDVARDRQDLSPQIRTFMPLGMLALSLLTVVLSSGPTFHFSPSEINLLFTGPFRRRDLIIYKFSAYVAGVILSCAFITPFTQAQTGSALTAFFATLLTLVFVQLNSAVITMSGQALEGSKLARLRWPAIALLFAVTFAAALYAWITPDLNLSDLLTEFRYSTLGTIILIPYIVFAELFVAPTVFPHLILWITIALLINIALLWMAIALDAHTTDRALSENSRQSDRWERIKQGGSFWATDRTEVRSIRRAPIIGGLGPIVWRQALNVARNSFKIIAVFIVMAACVGPLAAVVGISATDTSAFTFFYFFFGFILPRTLVCDFRGDLIRMEIYKTLPIEPWRICAGQLVAQVVLGYVIAVTMIISILLFDDNLNTSVALALLAFALPLTLLIYAVENTIHLLFPTKLVPMGRADFEFLGRSFSEFTAKTIIVLVAASSSAAVGLITITTLGTSLALSALASWTTLTLFGLLTLSLMQFAFRRFAVAETVD